MAWTYVDPSASNRDAVRFWVGQTSSGDDVLLSDGEVDYCLAQQSSNVVRAAAFACDILASRYAKEPTNESVGALGLSWGDRAKAFRQQARTLRLGHGGVSGYVGGVSEADVLVDQTDTDRVAPSFSIGRDDNPNTSRNADESST